MSDIPKELTLVFEAILMYRAELKEDTTPIHLSKIKAIENLLIHPRERLIGGSNTYWQEIEIAVYRGKLQQIKDAETKEDLKQILAKPDVHYNGNKLVAANSWVLPEEELVIWSNTSLQAPLNHEGFNRYMELFKEVYPEKVAQIQI